MNKNCLFISFLALFSLATCLPNLCNARQSSFERGKSWFEQRAVEADSFRAEPKYINNAIEAFEEVLSRDSSHVEEASLYLLQAYYFKGMFAGLEKDEQKEVYDKGRELGEKAEARFPKSAAIKFWYGANVGRWASVHGFFASATSGVAKTLRKLCEEIISLDDTYQGGGGYRILAQVHFHSPKIPLIMGWPSDKKALELVEKAMDIAPDHPTNRLLYAEILISFDRTKEAKEHLEYITKQEPRAEALLPDRYVKYRAKELIEEHYGV